MDVCKNMHTSGNRRKFIICHPAKESAAQLVEMKRAASQVQGVSLVSQLLDGNLMQMLFAVTMHFKQPGLPKDLQVPGHFVLWHF